MVIRGNNPPPPQPPPQLISVIVLSDGGGDLTCGGAINGQFVHDRPVNEHRCHVRALARDESVNTSEPDGDEWTGAAVVTKLLNVAVACVITCKLVLNECLSLSELVA